MPRPIALSKSRFVYGLQCHKQLWWRVHEPDAPELKPDESLQAVFDQGNRVGQAAREHVPGGVLIQGAPWAKDEKVARTREAITQGARIIYEASFEADGTFVAVDILERTDDGWRLNEVKSVTKVKEDAHLPDIAVQHWVARKAGLPVARADLMHLNRECRAPDLSNLFERADLTAPSAELFSTVETEIPAQLRMLAGPLPDVPVGDHCDTPYECPFKARCWPERPPHHIDTLPRLSPKKRAALAALGVETIHQIPPNFELTAIQDRQRQAVVRGTMLIESALADELEQFDAERIAFLDFETVAEAIPVWHGCRPYDQVPAQFSCHVRDGSGALSHHEWIADGPADPRPELARRVVEACRGADIVVAFNASFEKAGLRLLAEGAPDLAQDLDDVIIRIRDLADPVRKGLYHPEFYGSYSLKPVVAALLPELAYDDLEVAEGATASVRLRRLMFERDGFTEAERQKIRDQLLTYCGRDTEVMVALLDKLRSLA
jgi:hypothetical protein